MYILRLAFIFALVSLAPLSQAQEALEDAGEFDSGWGGSAGTACTVLSKATIGVAAAADFQTAKSDTEKAKEEYLQAWSDILYDAQVETGVSIDAIDAKDLAPVMQAIESEADTTEEEDESMSAFDIARTSLSVASIADPTGAIGVAAAYTYPKCGTQDAEESTGGFCWKNSEVRDAGSRPKNLGRVADCPAGYTNNGLTCGRGADSYAQPSRVADCPAGYTNNGLTCGRGADSYRQPSRVASCPAGYTNNGLTCGRGADSYSNPSRVADCPSGYTNHGLTCFKNLFAIKGLGSMSCKSGEWFQAGRCYKNCRSGYTNMGESCFRGVSTLGLSAMSCKAGEWFQAGRCYSDCRSGYTNMGETCFRGVSTLGLSAMSCKAGEWFQAGRCYSDCRSGYTNMGESCFRGVSTLGIGSMSCKAGEFRQGPRCFDNDVCPPGKELDGLLCYNTCNSGMKGIGPVCWSSCSGKLPVECAAGCASTAAECGLATTDMVASPLEMIGSIATLGGYSGAKSSRKAATLAAKQGAKALVRDGTKTALQQGARAAAGKLNDLMVEAAKVARSEGAEASARLLRKGMIENAEKAARRTEKVVASLKNNASRAKETVKRNVFDPVKSTAKAADKKLRSKSEIFDTLRKAQEKVSSNRKLNFLKAAHRCTDTGLTIADVSTD